MNQKKIGQFIAQCRKKKNLTQAQLAEQLNITDRAVSKWETGNSMPDSSIMLELCEILGITVNELLSGEEIHMENYETRADENLLALKQQDENNLSKEDGGERDQGQGQSDRECSVAEDAAHDPHD